MDAQTYRAWWPLHLRMAKGETLNADEQTLYEAGLQQLDAEEAEAFRPDEEIDLLRDLRERVLAANAEYQRLSKQNETMRTEMARLVATTSTTVGALTAEAILLRPSGREI